MITLDKAIEILTYYGEIHDPENDPDLIPALKLGIEALKAWNRIKQGHQFTTASLLPGEDPPESKTIPIETLVKIRESPIGKK